MLALITNNYESYKNSMTELPRAGKDILLFLISAMFIAAIYGYYKFVVKVEQEKKDRVKHKFLSNKETYYAKQINHKQTVEVCDVDFE